MLTLVSSVTFPIAAFPSAAFSKERLFFLILVFRLVFLYSEAPRICIFLGYWWWIVPPGLLIVVTALCFVFIAQGLEPVVNPRLRRMR